jgi:hypothetical protein
MTSKETKAAMKEAKAAIAAAMKAAKEYLKKEYCQMLKDVECEYNFVLLIYFPAENSKATSSIEVLAVELKSNKLYDAYIESEKKLKSEQGFHKGTENLVYKIVFKSDVVKYGYEKCFNDRDFNVFETLLRRQPVNKRIVSSNICDI